MTAFFVTGTDTGIGKTVFSAGLAGRLGAQYWKPIQSGLEDETDSAAVTRLSGAPALPEALRLALPASPNISAAAEGRQIDISALVLPRERPLVVEGAGGVMVPLNDKALMLDLMVAWRLPVILCARTALGTINHSLLSLLALRARRVTVWGVAFIGPPEPQVEATITRIGDVRHLGRLPLLPDLNAAALRAAFDAAFPPEAFAGAPA